MNSKRKPYKKYTKEFKFEALRLMEGSDRPASEIARTKKGPKRGQIYLNNCDFNKLTLVLPVYLQSGRQI